MSYLAVIDEADGMFGVVFPEAPGCTAMAESREAAIEQAKIALAEWVGDAIADGLLPPMTDATLRLARTDTGE